MFKLTYILLYYEKCTCTYVRYKLNVVARFHTCLPYIHTYMSTYVYVFIYVRKYSIFLYTVCAYIQYVLIYSMCLYTVCAYIRYVLIYSMCLFTVCAYIQYVLIYGMCLYTVCAFLLNVAGGVGKSALTIQLIQNQLVNNTV